MTYPYRLLIVTAALTTAFMLPLLACNSYAQTRSLSETTGTTASGVGGDPYSGHILSLKSENKINTEEATALLGVMEKARLLSMPHKPLNDKLDEGLTKRVPPMKVASVLERRVNDYSEVKNLLGQYRKNWPDTVRADLIGRLADCYGYGVTRDELSAMIRKAPASSLPSLTQGTEAYAALKQRGINPDSARNVIEAAMMSDRFSDWNSVATMSKLAAEQGITQDKAMSAMMDSIGKFGDMRGVPAALGISEHTARQSAVNNRDTAPTGTQREGMSGDAATGRSTDKTNSWSGGKSQGGESVGSGGHDGSEGASSRSGSGSSGSSGSGSGSGGSGSGSGSGGSGSGSGSGGSGSGGSGSGGSGSGSGGSGSGGSGSGGSGSGGSGSGGSGSGSGGNRGGHGR